MAEDKVDLAAYVDEYTESIRKLIEPKAEGKSWSHRPPSRSRPPST